MKNKEKILNLLGMAKRAGKLVTGDEQVLKKIRAGKVKYTFVASDSGKNTLKKFTDKCQSYQVPLNLDFTKQELSIAIGQSRTIIGVEDNGFAKKFKELHQA